MRSEFAAMPNPLVDWRNWAAASCIVTAMCVVGYGTYATLSGVMRLSGAQSLLG
ncbi:hypothetical protein ACFYWS_25220 [Streptomyces sp. NPDC002795]|uniref:hypothetical protein n=1 Tax=Streptomyces sp. NPDC002795 TaxID=3364665 RepID=UPI0036ABC913